MTIWTPVRVFRLLTHNGFPIMRTRTTKVAQLTIVIAWGWLGIAASAGAQVSSGNRVAPVPPAATQKAEAAPSAPVQGPLTDRPEEEKAIRAVAEAFTGAYNAGDAKAVAALYTEDAEFIDEYGGLIQGRPLIQDFYSAIFQERPGVAIEIALDSLRFLGPDVAKEEGQTRLKPSGGQPATVRRYTVLFVKKEGRWSYSSVREEHETALAHHERLKNLEWMVGEWLDQSSDSTVHVSCRWSEDKNFLLRDFTIHVQGQRVMTVSQRIGWDPLTRQIKSWFFDSEGGYGDALWVHKGGEWVIKSTGVLPDGQTATATNMLVRIGPNKASWKSTERTLGGQSVPDSAEYIMVRRLPPPQSN
jgi:uncharacterized protein (TIGR02246 family)